MAHEIVRSEDGDPRDGARERAPAWTEREDVPGYAEARSKFDRERRRGLEAATMEPDAAEGTFGRHRFEDVIGADDRTRIPDPVTPPWCWICKLRIQTAHGGYVGTGFFIGPRTVATAGHCVFLHETGAGWAESIEIIPALSGTTRPFGSVRATRFRTTAAFARDPDAAGADYGVIQLDAPFGEGRWFSYGSLPDPQLLGAIANICGYPRDRPRLDEGAGDYGTQPYFHARGIERVEDGMLHYDVDTFGGQSGAPVWITAQGRRVVIGVHTTGSQYGNRGTRINREVYETLRILKNEQ